MILLGYCNGSHAGWGRGSLWSGIAPRVHVKPALKRVTCRWSGIRVFLTRINYGVKAFQDRRAPWYLCGLIRKPLRNIGVILLHDVEHCFPGEIAMVLGK
jgi:hypothetical protein